ncbi:MAG: flippase-like domain-containing protein [Ktedonobacteraceae bacterium]|nr:flippase-like domain-containing protein [Ktedonobacteraceae bacterium]
MSTEDIHKTPVLPITEGTSEIIEKKKSELLQQGQQATGQEEPEITREQLSLSKRFLNWRTLVPLAVVLILLVIFAQRASINPRKIGEAILSANLLFFLLAFFIYYCSFIMRSLRWRILLQNAGFTENKGVQLPGHLKLVEIIYISFFANTIVPAKLGDIYRAYLLRQETGVPTTRSFGTVIAERFLDLAMLLTLLIPAVIVSLHEHLPPQIFTSLQVLLAIVVAGLIGLFVLRRAREAIAHLVPTRFRSQYYHFHEGTLGSFRRMPLLIILTLGVWTCEALRFFFVALSLNLIGGSLLHILAAAIFIGLGESLLTAIPTTGGGVGLVEGGMAAMIALFSQGNSLVNLANLTAAAILLDRTITFFSILIIGFFVFLLAFGRRAASQPVRKQTSAP